MTQGPDRCVSSDRHIRESRVGVISDLRSGVQSPDPGSGLRRRIHSALRQACVCTSSYASVAMSECFWHVLPECGVQSLDVPHHHDMRALLCEDSVGDTQLVPLCQFWVASGTCQAGLRRGDMRSVRIQLCPPAFYYPSLSVRNIPLKQSVVVYR